MECAQADKKEKEAKKKKSNKVLMMKLMKYMLLHHCVKKYSQAEKKEKEAKKKKTNKVMMMKLMKYMLLHHCVMKYSQAEKKEKEAKKKTTNKVMRMKLMKHLQVTLGAETEVRKGEAMEEFFGPITPGLQYCRRQGERMSDWVSRWGEGVRRLEEDGVDVMKASWQPSSSSGWPA